MASFRHFVTILALCTILAIALGQSGQGGSHTNQGASAGPQGGSHENQWRSRREAQGTADELEDDEENNPPKWIPCDYIEDPRLSCSDCNTRVICKPIGGLVKPCHNPRRPYCNNGLCSPVPNPDCA